LLFLFCWNNAAAQSTLQKIAKADSRDNTQLFFTFDSLPKYSYKLSNKRLDILLQQTHPAPDLLLFENDDRIIKTVPIQHDEMMVVSLFFRYQPQNIKLEPSADGKLVLDILLGNRYSRSYQSLSERLKGLTVVEEENVDFSNPLLSSPYAYDWESFFKNYEPQVQINVPIDFSAPPFPVIALIPPHLEHNSAVLPSEILAIAERKEWNTMVPQLSGLLQSANDVETKKLLALTYGEALLHSDDFEDAYKQLYLLAEQYPSEHIGILAKYLLILLEARFRDPFLADYDFRTLEQSITPSHPLAPYLLLSRVETALATKQFEQARLLLNRDDIALPDNTQKLRELRQGDYYSGTTQMVKAYVSYMLLKDTQLLKIHPYSLNGYCNTIYRQKKFDQAAACFRELAPQVSDSATLGLIAYKTNMAELHFKADDELIAGFARIEDAFPGTEAAARAAIKQADLRVLKSRTLWKQCVTQYHHIAKDAVRRATVAEASFKEALLYSLLGENKKSIDLLLVFLRNFKTTPIRDSGLALLIDLLPNEIKRLIDEGNYLDALVLVKKNRSLFQNNWLDLSLMADIANAYQKVGIFREAQNIYLYLLEMGDVEKREEYFLPLIRATFDQGEYNRVDDLCSQYNYNYPEGKDREPILILRLKSLIILARFTEARKRLPSPLPDTAELLLLASEIFFNDQDYGKTREALEQINPNSADLPIDAQFRLAESRYQLGDFSGAKEIFSPLVQHGMYKQQSLYRLAQIERYQGNEGNALKLFREIVEKGTDSLWKSYAEKELEYSQLNSSIQQMIDG